jgi:hypothetical protein
VWEKRQKKPEGNGVISVGNGVENTISKNVLKVFAK